MKTAMQEMIEYLENTWYVKEIRDWEDIKINILEKEKEQMQDFAKKCLDKALDLDIRTAYDMVEEYHKQIYSY